jgi:hypothetical protein
MVSTMFIFYTNQKSGWDEDKLAGMARIEKLKIFNSYFSSLKRGYKP